MASDRTGTCWLLWFVLILFGTASVLHTLPEAQGRDENPEVNASPPTLVTVSGHERSAVSLQSDGRPYFVLYARGTLAAELSVSRPSDSEWTWIGHIEHVPPSGEPQRHELSFSSEAPEEISLNGKAIPIPSQPANPDDPDEKTRGPWFVLTSYGRAVPTGRYFTFPELAELDRERTYSHAWYFDRDLHEAEAYRNTLEMDDLKGWVLAWDQQHCISHSDSARVARLRIFPDGRLVASRSHSGPLIERQITPTEVQSLIDAMLEMTEKHAPEQLANLTVSGSIAIQVFPSALGRGLWDQHQDLVRIQHEERLHSMRVVHPGRSDRVGRVPEGWDAMRDRLWDLISESTD